MFGTVQEVPFSTVKIIFTVMKMDEWDLFNSLGSRQTDSRGSADGIFTFAQNVIFWFIFQ